MWDKAKAFLFAIALVAAGIGVWIAGPILAGIFGAIVLIVIAYKAIMDHQEDTRKTPPQ